MSMEHRIEQFAEIILKPDLENWDAKNRAILQLIDVIKQYENENPTVISEVFTPECFRLLKEPIKLLIVDLRSQQVRDICQLLIELSKICGDRMKLFLRDSFPHILEGIKVPNKVMSNYVDECILALIHHGGMFKSIFTSLHTEIKENKAKFVREKCLEYIYEILQLWELNDKEIDPLCESIKIALEDASVKARETARSCYLLLYRLFPKKAEKLRLDLPKPLQAKLVKEELQMNMNSSADSENSSSSHHTGSVSSNSHLHTPSKGLSTAKSSRIPPSSSSASRPVTANTIHTSAPASKPTTPHHQRHANTISTSSNHLSHIPPAHHHHDKHHHSMPANSPSLAIHTPSSAFSAARDKQVTSNTPSTVSDSYTSGTKIAMMSSVDQAASAIQQGVRNALSRRRSVVKNPFAELSDSFSGKGTGNSVTFDEGTKGERMDALPTTSSFMNDKTPFTAGMHNDLSPYRSEDWKERKLPQAVLPTDNNQATEKVRRLSLSDKYPQHLSLNMKASVTLSKDRKVNGTIRFIGHTLFAPGIWVGVELNTPDGKNNGSVQGHYYFSCPANYGLFIREEYVAPLPVDTASTVTTVASSSGSVATSTIASGSAPGTTNGNPISAIRNEVRKAAAMENTSAKTSTSTNSNNSRNIANKGRDFENNVDSGCDDTGDESKGKKMNSNSPPPPPTCMKSNNGNNNAINSSIAPRTASFTDNMTVYSGISEMNYSYHSSSSNLRTTPTTPGDRKGVTKSSSILKMKLSKMMDLLNQQLEIVEELEKQEKLNPLSETVLLLRHEIQTISNDELEAMETFLQKWKDFPKLEKTMK